MKFYKVNNKEELERVIQAQKNLKNLIQNKSINQRLLDEVINKALNNEREIVDIQEKIIFNENLEEINKKREEEGLEPLQPKPIETTLQKEQIARKGLEVDKIKLNNKDLTKFIIGQLKKIDNLKRQLVNNRDDTDEEFIQEKINETRNNIIDTMQKRADVAPEISGAIDQKYESEFNDIMSELSGLIPDDYQDDDFEDANDYDIDEDYEIEEKKEEIKNEKEITINEGRNEKETIYLQREYVLRKELDNIKTQLSNLENIPINQKKILELNNKTDKIKNELDEIKESKKIYQTTFNLPQSSDIDSNLNLMQKMTITTLKNTIKKYNELINIYLEKAEEYKNKGDNEAAESYKDMITDMPKSIKKIEEIIKNININTPDNELNNYIIAYDGFVSGLLDKYKKTGSGLNKSKKLNKLNKVNNNGQYGKINIDMNDLLNNLRLVVYKNDKKVMSKKVTEDVVDLLTKRFNSKKQYDKSALDIYEKVLELAEIRPKLIKKKEKLLTDSVLYYTPDEMVMELNKLTNKKGLSQLKKNKGVALLDKLLQLGVIDKDQHKQIYKNNFE